LNFFLNGAGSVGRAALSLSFLLISLLAADARFSKENGRKQKSKPIPSINPIPSNESKSEDSFDWSWLMGGPALFALFSSLFVLLH